MRAKQYPDNWHLQTVIHRGITGHKCLSLIGVLNIVAEVLNVDLAVGQRTKKATKGCVRSRLHWYFNVADIVTAAN